MFFYGLLFNKSKTTSKFMYGSEFSLEILSLRPTLTNENLQIRLEFHQYFDFWAPLSEFFF